MTDKIYCHDCPTQFDNEDDERINWFGDYPHCEHCYNEHFEGLYATKD